MLEKASCNVETYGDAMLTWFSDSIKVMYWPLVYNIADDENADDSSEEWDRRRLRQSADECKPESLASSVYKSEKRLQSTKYYCGFKFQVINNANSQYDFTVLRNGSEAIAATILATSAILALF